MKGGERQKTERWGAKENLSGSLSFCARESLSQILDTPNIVSLTQIQSLTITPFPVFIMGPLQKSKGALGTVGATRKPEISCVVSTSLPLLSTLPGFCQEDFELLILGSSLLCVPQVSGISKAREQRRKVDLEEKEALKCGTVLTEDPVK